MTSAFPLLGFQKALCFLICFGQVEVTDRGLPAYLQRINHMVFESSGHRECALRILRFLA